MLKHMRTLQKLILPLPAHRKEHAKIAQIQKELNEQLGWPRYARLQCLLDTEHKLRKAVADENFAAGFKLGWMIAKELREVTDHGQEAR